MLQRQFQEQKKSNIYLLKLHFILNTFKTHWFKITTQEVLTTTQNVNFCLCTVNIKKYWYEHLIEK